MSESMANPTEVGEYLLLRYEWVGGDREKPEEPEWTVRAWGSSGWRKQSYPSDTGGMENFEPVRWQELPPVDRVESEEPLKPCDVHKISRSLFCDHVIPVVNRLIKGNWNGFFALFSKKLFFEKMAANTGLNEKQLKDMGPMHFKAIYEHFGWDVSYVVCTNSMESYWIFKKPMKD